MTIKLYQKYKEKGLIRKNEVSVVDEPIKEINPKEKYLSEIIEQINSAQGLINKVIPILDSACSKYVQMLNELLQKKKEKEAEPKYYQQTTQNNKPKQSKKKNLKRMYSKIANECHPDKTDDTSKHEMFLKAKKAMENDDEYAIYEIYKEFDDKVSIEDFVNLDQQILEKTVELSKLHKSNSYKISLIYDSGKTKDAKRIYLQGIMEQIQKLEMEAWD